MMRTVLVQVSVLALFLAGAVGPAAAEAAQAPGAPCPDVCTMMYAPVTCEFASGATMTFGNRCTADGYACRHGLRIVGCVAKRG